MLRMGELTSLGFQVESGVMGEGQLKARIRRRTIAEAIRIICTRNCLSILIRPMSQYAYAYPPESKTWKKSSTVDQTAGVPPNQGRMNFPIIGWI
jgi:hypothetical protein